MFIQLFLDATKFIMVNSNHIVSLEPDRNGRGTSVTLVTGLTFIATDEYNAILQNIAIAKR